MRSCGRRGLRRRSRRRGHRRCLGGAGDGQRPPRIDPVGIGEGATSRLGQAHVGPEDGRPLLAVSVVLDGEAPQRVAGHDGVGDGGRCCEVDWAAESGASTGAIPDVVWESSCTTGAGLAGGPLRTASGSRVGTTELTENQDGGDQGRHGAGADQVGAVTGPTTTDLVDKADDDRKDEVGPGQPGQDGEQAWPERVRDRSAEGVRRLTAARDVVRERPADDGWRARSGMPTSPMTKTPRAPIPPAIWRPVGRSAAFERIVEAGLERVGTVILLW